ncbi:Type I polyketide synthase [Sulfidibacter corallicola]|uniref:Type I polyketide synthase n=1 Tax=Sulfidibacter corallicola TaxID=2818388 RepID=A0A8A4TTX1_SULCO|nr:type I polyketide synthase [Sulfidibacter corallicola]QTD52923.1 type I polyketide synthase [Sulfidibacter corallicola]
MWEMNGTEIAVIGMSGRFPGADSIESYWELLQKGKDAYKTLTPEEAVQFGASEELVGHPNFQRVQCAMDGIDQFDHDFFGIDKHLAAAADPQHRVFLECCWDALETAGYNPAKLDHVAGVYAAADQSTYFIHNVLPHFHKLIEKTPQNEIELANSPDFVATRVSYHLNLKGPSYTVKCACSSAMVAVHNACQAILEGECDMALAGGISILVNHMGGYLADEKGFYSKDGRIRPFDRDATGFLRGSGGGVVVLKRLEDAVAEGDNILAVIRGSAVCNDGGDKAKFIMPSVTGIAESVVEALAVSGIHASSLRYVEAQGLGQPVSDPIEIRALHNAFRADGALENGFCLIGSAKGNIGHLSEASGIASLIKAVMAVQRAEIPGIANLNHLNPNIDFENTPFTPVRETVSWPECEGPRRAGVINYGLGGTNVFMILEQAPPKERNFTHDQAYFFPLSARSPEALACIRRDLATHLERHPELHPADVAFTLQAGRAKFDHRLGLVAGNMRDLIQALRNDDAPLIWRGHSTVDEICDPVFFYGTVEDEPLRAGLELIQQQSICQTIFEKVWTRARLEWDGSGEAFLDHVHRNGFAGLSTYLKSAVYLLCCYVITEWWRYRGITPRAVAGLGVGDLVAGAVSGAASLEQTLAILKECHKNISAADKLENIPNLPTFHVSEITWYSGLMGEEVAYKSVEVRDYMERFIIGSWQLDAMMSHIEQTGFLRVFDITGASELDRSICTSASAVAPRKQAPFSDIHLITQIAECWLSGIDIHWSQYYGKSHPNRVMLPSYPFERQRCWVDRA